MDCKGDIWSTSVQLLKSLDASDPVILGIGKFTPKEELGSHFVIMNLSVETKISLRHSFWRFMAALPMSRRSRRFAQGAL
jgi:hypothetical protein